MLNLLKTLGYVILGSACALAQGGPYAPTSVTWTPISIVSAWNTTTLSTQGGFTKPLPYASWPSGMVAATFANVSGSPSGCNIFLNFSNGSALTGTGTLASTSGNFTPANGTIYLRFSATNLAATAGVYTAITPSWNCAVYPTSGQLTIEFSSDTQPTYTYAHINSNTSTQLKTQPSYIHTLTFNTAGTSETITIFDNTTCTGTTFAVITNPSANESSLLYDAQLNVGLCILTSGTTAGDYTVTYR